MRARRTTNNVGIVSYTNRKETNGKNYGIFRLNKIKLSDGGALKGRIKHSWRELKDESLDKDKCQYLKGQTAQEIFENYKKNISTLTQTPRSNAVGSLEIVITCTKNSIPNEEQTNFMNDAKKAIEKQFGKENIIGVALHRDETTPHLHAFVTPIQTMNDGTKKLNAKNWTGGKQKMVELQNFFHKEVFPKYGLERGEAAEITQRKNQRPKLEAKEKLLRGKEKRLDERERKIATAEKKLLPKIDALRTVENVPKFPPVLEAVPIAKLPAKKIFESAEKLAEKTAEATFKFCQKQYENLHKAYNQVSQAIGAEKLMRQSAEKDAEQLKQIIDGMSKELDQAKKLVNDMTPNQAEKLAAEMRKNDCQNYGELNQKIHDRKQAEIARQSHEKALQRTQTKKKGSDMGWER